MIKVWRKTNQKIVDIPKVDYGRKGGNNKNLKIFNKIITEKKYRSLALNNSINNLIRLMIFVLILQILSNINFI